MKYTLDPSVNKDIIFLPRPDLFSSSAEDGSGSGAKAQKALVSGNNRCPMGYFSITFSPLSLCFHQLFYWGLVWFGFGIRHQLVFISKPNPIYSSRCNSNSTHLGIFLFIDILNKHQYCADFRDPKMKTTLIAHRIILGISNTTKVNSWFSPQPASPSVFSISEKPPNSSKCSGALEPSLEIHIQSYWTSFQNPIPHTPSSSSLACD